MMRLHIIAMHKIHVIVFLSLISLSAVFIGILYIYGIWNINTTKDKKLYFVDSRSCENPIAKGIADKKDVNCFERNIFLDGRKTKAYIRNQLIKAQDIALKKGKAIAIGHVGTEGGIPTAEAISEMLPEFDRNNISLVLVSELQN